MEEISWERMETWIHDGLCRNSRWHTRSVVLLTLRFIYWNGDDWFTRKQLVRWINRNIGTSDQNSYIEGAASRALALLKKERIVQYFPDSRYWDFIAEFYEEDGSVFLEMRRPGAYQHETRDKRNDLKIQEEVWQLGRVKHAIGRRLSKAEKKRWDEYGCFSLQLPPGFGRTIGRKNKGASQ